jgi:hypothetical protein
MLTAEGAPTNLAPPDPLEPSLYFGRPVVTVCLGGDVTNELPSLAVPSAAGLWNWTAASDDPLDRGTAAGSGKDSPLAMAAAVASEVGASATLSAFDSVGPASDSIACRCGAEGWLDLGVMGAGTAS